MLIIGVPPPVFLAGARAPEGSPDERDPGQQKLLAQQNSGLAKEFHFFLILFILRGTGTFLPQGGPGLAEPPSPSIPPSLQDAPENRGT